MAKSNDLVEVYSKSLDRSEKYPKEQAEKMVALSAKGKGDWVIKQKANVANSSADKGTA